MARTYNEIVKSCTDDYLNNIDINNPPRLRDVEAELVCITRDAISAENQIRAKGEKLPLPAKLLNFQIAAVILKLRRVINVLTLGENASHDFDILAVYQNDGENAGLYDTDECILKRMIVELNYLATVKEMQEVLDIIRLDAPRVMRTIDKDLVPVQNGIFNYSTKRLEEFSSKYVFLTKTRVNYNPQAKNVIYHNAEDGTDWNIESWMDELSDDPEIVNLLWCVLSASVRPFVPWGKSAFLYSASGCSGKSSFTELMRQLSGSYASIPISDFSKDFALEPLLRVNNVISDEQDLGDFISKASCWKAAATNDVIKVNRKFKEQISYKFYGFMTFCVNDMPRFKDTSDSLFRRILFIPFDKNFIGTERKYIKEEYLHRTEVLEYVLQRVLNTDFYEFTVPEKCQKALAEYKEYNDPVRQFLDDVLHQCVWDFLPFSFLYELYKAYSCKNNPRGKILGRNTFINELLNLLSNYPEWYCSDKHKSVRTGAMMDLPEPLIVEYDLVDFKNTKYTGTDVDIIARPTLADSYRGILRMKQ